MKSPTSSTINSSIVYLYNECTPKTKRGFKSNSRLAHMQTCTSDIRTF